REERTGQRVGPEGREGASGRTVFGKSLGRSGASPGLGTFQRRMVSKRLRARIFLDLMGIRVVDSAGFSIELNQDAKSRGPAGGTVDISDGSPAMLFEGSDARGESHDLAARLVKRTPGS